MHKIDLIERPCDNCGSSSLSKMWEYSTEAITRNNSFLWNVVNVVCNNCGFAFVSPVASPESLNKYYSDAYSLNSEQSIDYSIKKRLNIVEKLIPDHGDACFLEIGSNNCPEFIKLITEMFSQVETVEPNDECSSTYSNIEAVPDSHVDTLACYFVLEHIANPKDFIAHCARINKMGGHLIIEVPNLYKYADDPAGLLLHEHVNHFSPISLARMAQQVGYQFIEMSNENCSRNFGFVAIFKKVEDYQSTIINDPLKHEVILATSSLIEGRAKIEMFHERIAIAQKKLDATQKRAFIWAANDVCTLLLKNYVPPKHVSIIDIDSKKRDYFDNYDVFLPEQMLEEFPKAELFVVNTARNSDSIRKWLTLETGKTYTDDQFVVLDYLN